MGLVWLLGGGWELVEAAGVGEEDERDLGVAEDGELVGLLEQAVPALGEGHLPADLVLDPLQHHLPAAHGGLISLDRSVTPTQQAAFLSKSTIPPQQTLVLISLATSSRQ